MKRPWLSESLQWYRIRRLIAISLWSFLYIMYCGFCPTRQGPLWKYHMNCSPHIYAFIKKQQVACLLGSYYFTWSATTEIKRPVRKQTKPFNGKSFQRGSLKACSTSSWFTPTFPRTKTFWSATKRPSGSLKTPGQAEWSHKQIHLSNSKSIQPNKRSRIQENWYARRKQYRSELLTH